MDTSTLVTCPHCGRESWKTMEPPHDDWCGHCGRLYDEATRKPPEPEREFVRLPLMNPQRHSNGAAF